MAALVTVHNDGPDAMEVRIGCRSVLLYAGQDFRIATSHAVQLHHLPQISAEELALHMGGRVQDGEKNRYAED